MATATQYDTANWQVTPSDPMVRIVHLEPTGIGTGVAANYLTVHRIFNNTGSTPVLVETPAFGAGVPFALTPGNSIDVSASMITISLPSPPSGIANGTTSFYAAPLCRQLFRRE